MRFLRTLFVLFALAGGGAAPFAQTLGFPPYDPNPPAGGTFNTPGYPPAGSTRQNLPGGQPGSPGAPPSSGSQQLPSLRGAMPPQRGASAPDAFQQQQQQQRRFLPPPKPSEFQRFVEIATGRLLPVFGARFFEDAADGFAPLDNVPVPADYTVAPGDEVIVRAWGSIDVDYRAIVDRNGQLNLPKVGSFSVAGVRASDLERHLRAQIGRLFTNFNLNVTLGALRGVKVFVVGPAARPGVYTLGSQSTVLSAVVAAGGPGPNGSMRKVLLRREGKVVSELDIYEFLVQGDKSRDLPLAAGDVVVFQSVGPRVALAGATDSPAIYELRSRDEKLADLLRYAGGAPVLANPSRAQLERIDPANPSAPRFVESFALDGAGLAKPLRDGDVLTLLAISPKFANAVTLKGHVAQPLRYPFTPGMRIRDLIPDREALISPDFYRRKNLLVQVIEDDERFDGSGSGNALRDPYGQDRLRSGPTYRDPARDPSRDPYRDPYRDPSRDGARDDGREPSRPLSEADRRRLRDANAEAGERSRRSPAPLFDELNWDYATIERLDETDLSTLVIPFNLGAAVLRGEATHNIELKAGDVVTVYSQKDIRVPVARQTRLVSVEGEVGAPGVYQLIAGETLRGLLTRAGGFSAQAYVYGLEFSREETRNRQRENLTQAIERLEALSATQAAREAANRRDDSARASDVSSAATQAQLNRLRTLQPNGRIALELTPLTTSLAELPELPLEHLDRIIVPARPGFVTVAGAVVNSNAFLWRQDRTAGDYIKLAGLDEAADTGQAFILRADGTVNHAGDRRGVFGFGSGIEGTTLQPGDAVIVPNQLDYETWGRALVRNLKDWSQIFYQFGLGAAAIQTLRRN